MFINTLSFGERKTARMGESSYDENPPSGSAALATGGILCMHVWGSNGNFYGQTEKDKSKGRVPMLDLLCSAGRAPIESTKDAVTAEPSDRDVIYEGFVQNQLRRKLGVGNTTLCTSYLSLRHTNHLQTPSLMCDFSRKWKKLGK